MRKSFFILLLLLLSIWSYGQDLIVRNTNDSISCQIDSISNDLIFFTMEYRNALRSTSVSMESVVSYDYGYYSRIQAVNDSIIALKLYPKFRIGISGGLGYQLQKIDDDFHDSHKDHLKKMKFGYVFGAEFQWFFVESMGISMNFRQFGTSTPRDTFTVATDRPYSDLFILSEKIKTQFIGPGFTYRSYNKEKDSSVLFGISLGYFSYRNDYQFFQFDPNYLKGASTGFGLSFAYEKGLGNNIYLGFSLSSLIGSISDVESTFDGEVLTVQLEEKENISRIDLTIVLSFSK